MRSIFTDFVRELEPGADIDREFFEHLWQALRGVLSVEMKRRSVWQTRPSFLGVVGHGRWVDGDVGSDGLDELTSDCFEFLFVRRRASLRRQIILKPNIDGLVYLGVRQFLLEMQSRNDPLGFHVFEVLRSTVEALVSRRLLWVVGGSSKIRNGTLLALDPEFSAEGCRGIDLDPLVERWAETHLETLVTATRGALKTLRQQLGDELTEYLGEHGYGMRFGDLTAPLKTRVRRNWAARFLNLPDFLASADDPPVVVSQAESLEEREHLAHLVRCLEGSNHSALGEEEQKYFEKLWRYIKAFALEIAAPEEFSSAVWDLGGDQLPSQRKLAHFLGIPRARLGDLFRHLRQRWESCTERLNLSTEVLAMAARKEDPTEDLGVRSPKGRAFSALKRAAASGAAAESTVFPSLDLARLGAGDFFVVSGAEVDGVEWLVISTDSRALRCVPVDAATIFSCGDIDLRPISNDGGRQAARLALEVSLPIASPWEVRRTGRFDEAALAMLLKAILERGDAPEEVSIELPTYRDWLEEGPELAREHLLRLMSYEEPLRPEGMHQEPRRSVLSRASKVRRAESWWGLAAAAVLLVSLVTNVQVARRNAELGHQVDRLSVPIIDLPYREIQVTPTVRGPWLLEVSESADYVQIGVILLDMPSYPEFRLELVHENGEKIYETPPLTPRREISLTLQTQLLSAEVLRLRVWGLDSGEPILLKEEKLQLVDAPH